MEPNSREFYKQCAFQKFCNTVLHNEACDTHRELRRHKAKEVTFSDMTLDEARQLHTFDEYLVKLPVPLVPLEKIPVPALHLPKLHKELFRHFQLVGFALPVLKADKIPCAAFRGFLPKRVCLNPVCHPVVLLQKMSEGISIPHPVARRMAGCFRSYKIFRSFFRRWSNLA